LIFPVNTASQKHSKNCATSKDEIHESRLLVLDPEVHADGFETFGLLEGIIGQCSLFCGGRNSGQMDIKMQKAKSWGREFEATETELMTYKERTISLCDIRDHLII
jgi:hypothetical protein